MSKTQKCSIVTPSDWGALVDCVLIQQIEQYELVAKFNAHTQTVRKWVKRIRKEGESGLEDRSFRPHKHPNATPPEKVAEIITESKERKQTREHIAFKLNIPQRKVRRHLTQAELSRQKDIAEPKDVDPPQQYEHEALGGMIHLDIKTLRNFNEENGIRHKSANRAAGT